MIFRKFTCLWFVFAFCWGGRGVFLDWFSCIQTCFVIKTLDFFSSSWCSCFGSTSGLLSECNPNKNITPPCLYFSTDMLGFGSFHQEHLSLNAPWTQTLDSKCPNWPIKTVQTPWAVCVYEPPAHLGFLVVTPAGRWNDSNTESANRHRPDSFGKRKLYSLVLPKQPHGLNEPVCRVWLNMCGKRLTTERVIGIWLPAQICSLQSCG